MVILSSLRAAWLWFRQYWQIIAVVVAFVAGYLLFRRQNADLTKQLDEIRKQYMREINDLQSAHDAEIRKREENERRLEQRLSDIQRQYDEAKRKLDDEKKKQVVEILEKYGDDPDELARRLSETTGFTVIIPLEDGK